MIRTWLALISVSLLVSLALGGCSKANNVNTDNGGPASGAQCSGAGDEGCGVGSVCVLGQCRHGCTNDAECPQGSICVGDRPPYGCTTEEESACTSNEDCPTGLDCGIDGKCRHGCQLDEDCPRNEHVCIASTCVGEVENDFDQWSCGDNGYERSVYYGNGSTESCNVGTPGNGFLDTCNQGQYIGFAQLISAVDLGSSIISGGLGEALACPKPDCASGLYVCPAVLDCKGDEMCEACTEAAYVEPFACRPSQNPMLEQCSCLDAGLMPECAQLPLGRPGTLEVVLRDTEDCQLVIPDAIRYTGPNPYVWPLAKDQALVVSDQGALVAGTDYELADGVITFSEEACARAHLTTYVCEGTCTANGGTTDPGTCEDIQDVNPFGF